MGNNQVHPNGENQKLLKNFKKKCKKFTNVNKAIIGFNFGMILPLNNCGYNFSSVRSNCKDNSFVSNNNYVGNNRGISESCVKPTSTPPIITLSIPNNGDNKQALRFRNGSNNFWDDIGNNRGTRENDNPNPIIIFYNPDNCDDKPCSSALHFKNSLSGSNKFGDDVGNNRGINENDKDNSFSVSNSWVMIPSTPPNDNNFSSVRINCKDNSFSISNSWVMVTISVKYDDNSSSDRNKCGISARGSENDHSSSSDPLGKFTPDEMKPIL